MGRPKALLPFGTELLLERIVRILGEVVAPIVVVGARDQPLPALPDNVLVVRDGQEGLGPLAGLATGLGALQGVVEAVYVTACDAPLLKAQFVSTMIAHLQEADLAIPYDGEHHHPLAAVYRVSIEPKVQAMLSAGVLRPLALRDQVRTREIDVCHLTPIDPALESLWNMNTPEDYRAALRALGLPSSGEGPQGQVGVTGKSLSSSGES